MILSCRKIFSVMKIIHKELYSVQFELIFQAALTKTRCIAFWVKLTVNRFTYKFSFL